MRTVDIVCCPGSTSFFGRLSKGQAGSASFFDKLCLRVRAFSLILSLSSVGGEFSYVLGPCQFSTPSPGVPVFLLSLFPRCNRFSLVHERLRPGEAREASRNPQFQVCANTRLALKKAGSECLFIFWPIGTSLTLSLSWPWP